MKKRTSTYLFVLLILAGGIFLVWRWAQGLPDIKREDIISENGLHWHAMLTIDVKGAKEKIPANIGLGAAEEPIHTHDDTGEIHIEFSAIVTRQDLRLGNFFGIWGKKFTNNCIFDHCNGPDGTMKMTVNGLPSNDFQYYSMRDGDKIEIRYE